MKRGLQIVLGILSIIPAYYGLYNLWAGIARFGSDIPLNPMLDGQFRFQSGVYFGLAMIIWWLIPRIQYETAIFRLVILTVFIGGIGRLLSYMTLGPAGPVAMGAMILEFVLPILILWQNLISKPNFKGAKS